MSIGQCNHVVLMGIIDDEPKYVLDRDKAFARLRVKTTRSFMLEGKKEERHDWHTVICYRELAEAASHALKRGDRIYLKGYLTYASWEAEDGKKRIDAQVVAQTLAALASDLLVSEKEMDDA